MSQTPSLPSARSRKERFYGGYTWLVLKNVIGWTVILVALVAGPVVPGPGGIPLFLIGFALVSFPGKRKLTARVLRGRRIALWGRSPMLVIGGFSLLVPALSLRLLGTRVEEWLSVPPRPALLTSGVAYLSGVVLIWLAGCGLVLLVNLFLRAMPPIRRRVRPWLRHHHVRLLPPRYRRRFAHEHGTGPIRLKGEIIAFLKRRHRAGSGSDTPSR